MRRMAIFLVGLGGIFPAVDAAPQEAAGPALRDQVRVPWKCDGRSCAGPPLREQVRAALDVLSEGANVDYAQFAIGVLADPQYSDTQWQDFFQSYFATRPFTGALAEFWNYAVEQSGPGAERTAVLSGLCATEALTAALSAQQPLSYASLSEAGYWLQSLSGTLQPAGRAAIFDAVAKGLESRPVDATRDLGLGPDADPQRTALGIQVCLTLSEYAPNQRPARAQLGRLLGLPESTRAFWEAYGMFLFDNGALDGAHVTSLDSLVGAFPAGLHAIRALILPESTGIDPNTHGLNSSGQLLFLSALPLEQLTDPGEFAEQADQPVAPEFTVAAGVQIVRAIQAVQFSRHPDLVHRRDTIVLHAGNRKERYLRRNVPPNTYRQQPDELLPMTAYLWLIDSAAAFTMAADLFQWRQTDAMDALLLLADVLSGGANTTTVFRTNPDGRVESERTTVGRTHLSEISLYVEQAPQRRVTTPVPADLDYLTAIYIRGTQWSFDLNDRGLSTRFHKITP